MKSKNLNFFPGGGRPVAPGRGMCYNSGENPGKGGIVMLLKKAWSAVRRWCGRADWWLIALALAVSLFGLVLIFSASRGLNNPNKFVIVQAAGLALGMIGFLILSVMEFERFPRAWLLIFVFNILFNLSLCVLGVADDTGNRSWIPLVGGINVQPGEVGKLLFIFTLGSHIYALRDKLNAPLSILQLGAHMGVTAVAVYIFSSDLGVTLMYPLIFITMLFAAGVSLWWMGGICLAGVGCLPILWKFMGQGQKDRILVVFDPSISPKRAWHAQQSTIAIGNGQLTGTGLTQGIRVQNGWVPGRQTDSIFAVCGEELGFIGCCALLLLLTALVVRIFVDAARTTNRMGALFCAGVGGMFMWQILINVGMMLGIVPVIGLTLPLCSYGGTSMVTTFAALGLVCGACMRQTPNWLRN